MPVSVVGDLDIHWDSAGSGEIVLLINGIGADRSAWGSQLPAIASQYQVVTFDNRDCGQTAAGRNPRSYGMEQFAVDTAGLLDALQIDRVHVIGASMGGAIAQEFAIRYPGRVRSVQIVCSWPKTDPWLAELMTQWDEVFARQGRVAWARTTWLWVFTHRYFELPGNLETLMELTVHASNPQTLEMNLRQSAAFKQHDALARLGEITAPTHVICGEEDIYTPLRYSIEIANAVPGATLSVIPEVGHGMFWETTAEFNRLILAFLDEQKEGYQE